MDRKLTTEFAQGVKLPMNPLGRHAIVSEMLEDPTVVGEGTVVTANSSVIQVGSEAVHVHINTVWPLLGRGALKKAAQTLEYLDNFGEE